jgi:aquaporin Z
MKLTLPIRQFLAEFYGTFILVFVGTGAIAFGADLLGIAIAFGSGAMIAIYTIGHISGAHLNPAVTLAMVLDKRMKPLLALLYVGAQLLGAFFASLSLDVASTSSVFKDLGASVVDLTTFTNPDTAFWIVLFFEVFLTFILVYMVLAVSQRKPLQPFIGLIVVLTLVGLILIGGPISSASLNPARSIAPALLTGGESLNQVWMFIVGPLLGSLLAVSFYRVLKFTDSDTL